MVTDFAAPRVSVIIPTFDRAACLRDAVESVLAQSLDDLEVIVVDDGSVDGTPAVMRDLARDRRVVPLRQDHRGISAAMNLGLRHARGSIVARLDSDDLWLPDLLATEVAVLDARPDVSVVYARASVEGNNRRDETWGHAPRFAESHLASMLYSDFTCNITVVARRACLDRIGGYDETLATSEDFDMWLRAAVAHRFAFVDRVLATVRVSRDSISVDPARSERNRQDRERVLDKFFARDDLPPEALAMRGTAYANLHTETALRQWGSGHRRAALRSLWRAMAHGRPRTRVLARFAYFALRG